MMMQTVVGEGNPELVCQVRCHHGVNLLLVRKLFVFFFKQKTAYEIQISMSRKGNCFDNACIESFHGTIKKERVYKYRYRTHHEAMMDIIKYIGFYNDQRMHSTLGYLSPNGFERAYPKGVTV